MSDTQNVPYLKRLSDNKEYPLLVRSMTIGRRDTCELILNDESGVSRQHATITLKEGDVFIEDLGSTNGVLINGEKINGLTKVNVEDKLIFDVYEYQLNMPQIVQAEDAKIKFNTIVVDEISEVPADLAVNEMQEEAAQDKASESAGTKDTSEPSPQSTQVQSGKPLREGDSVESRKSKAAWIEERNAGATMFMPAADGSTEVGAPVSIDYEGAEPALIVIEGGTIGQTFELSGSNDKWNIGSSQSQDVILSIEGVSESHATLSRDGKKWELRDLLSQNGIRVNGNKTLHSFLASEDVIKLGPVKCLFVIPKGYKASAKQSSSIPDKRSWLKPISAFLLLAFIALSAANYFELIDIKNLLSGFTG